ncbi:mitochondrial carrier [Paratrimastix pyriformis]|uniref:Membrane carrier 4 n=1 Tax=Paratrimastix pyriformis TaxID=342808 RepID=M4QWA2_9EUKA|nr:membrane carrier 4 [Paratrimastix pyriformis]KAJ4455744.1 mitochondrial carrier [Paratrimastix pyriformis]
MKNCCQKKSEKPEEKRIVKKESLISSIASATLQGCVGAVVGAALASVTDPIVNRVLVKRVPLSVAIHDVTGAQMFKYFQTALATNMIKFPMFEVLNKVVAQMPLPDSTRGLISGAIFTTATLPITNYRFSKSMGEPINMASLYKAYWPTVARDMLYGVVRNRTNTLVAQNFPKLNANPFGKMFAGVMAACLLSSPGNEVRGYFLQPPQKRLPVGEFFKVDRYVRSAALGATVMALSLGVGAFVSKPLEAKFRQLLVAAQQKKPQEQKH